MSYITCEIQINFQLELINQLVNKFGKEKIILKFHPSISNFNRAILLSNLPDMIPFSDIPFEQIENIDCVALFESIQTTAFRTAIINKWSIVALDMPNLLIQKNIKNDLSKRVAFLKCYNALTEDIQLDSTLLEEKIIEAKIVVI